MMLTVVLLFGVVFGKLSGFRRAMSQVDYCEPLDFPTPAIDNCIACPNCPSLTGCHQNCDKCAERFFLNTATPRTCSACIANCMNCTGPSTCIRCARGMFFQSGSCQGSLANCGSQAPDVFQPVIAGGLNLVGGTNLEITAEFSNYFHSVKMTYPACTKTTQSGPTPVQAPADQVLCRGTYSAIANYLTDCNFDFADNGDTYVFSGSLNLEVNYDIFFLGVSLAEPGYLKRPVGWKLTLNKLLTAEVAMTIKNDDLCEGVIPNVYGTKSTSAICHGSGCLYSIAPDLDNATKTTYLKCTCDPCHAGFACETDTCAPTPSCPTGTLVIDLTATRTPADAYLTIAPGAFKPSAIDNTASGWSETATANITITRWIGASEAVVRSAGVDTDDLMTMLWDITTTYSLNTVYVVTYKFDDNLGNPSYCHFGVKIVDTGKPTLSCPGNIVTNTMPTWSLVVPTSDNVDSSGNIAVTQTTGDASGAVTPNTNQLITLKATDLSGNFATCTFTVIHDITPPAITCPAPYAVDVNVDSVTGIYTKLSWTDINNAIVFSDPLSGLNASSKTITGDADGTQYTQQSLDSASYIYQPSGGEAMGVGGRLYTQSDLAGNSATCIVRVRVTDITPPIVNCPPPQTYIADAGSNGYFKTGWAAMFSSSDNVGVKSFTSLETNRSFLITSGLRAGLPWTVTYSATDNCGLTATCYTLVYVNDNQKPTITCPGPITLPMDTGVNTYRLPSTLPWAAPTYADNDGATTPTHNSPVPFPKGATTVTYTVRDFTGNSKTCTFGVTVVDTQDPILTCPVVALSMNTQPGRDYWTANFWSASSSYARVSNWDNDLINAASRTTNYVNGAHLVWTTGPDPITVTYYVEDVTGNNDTCSFDVYIHDNQAPIIACSNKVIKTDLGSKYGTYPEAWGFVANDNADPTVGVGSVSYAPSTLEYLRGVNTIQASATDEDLNTGTCSFTLTVNQRCGDLYVADGEECDHQHANQSAKGIGCTLNCTCDNSRNYWQKNYTDFDCLWQVPKDDVHHKVIGAKVDKGGDLKVNANKAGAFDVLVDATPKTDEFTNVGQAMKLTKAKLGVQFKGTSNRRRMTAGVYLMIKICPTVNDYTLNAYLFNNDNSSGIDTEQHCASIGTSPPPRYFDGSCWDFAVCGSGLIVFGMSTPLDWIQCNDVSSQTAVTTSGYTVPVAFNAASRIQWLPDGVNSGAGLVVDTSYGPTGNISSPFPMPPNGAGQRHTLFIKACNATICGAACLFDVAVFDGVAPTLTCNSSALTLSLDAGSSNRIYTLPVVFGKDETTFLGSPFSGSPTYEYLTEDTTTAPIVPAANFAAAAGSSYSGGATATLTVGTSIFTWSVTDGAANGPTTCRYTISVRDTESPVLTCPDRTITTGPGLATGTLATSEITVIDNLDPVSTRQAPVGTYTVGRHSIFYYTTDTAGNAANCTFFLTVNDNQAPTLSCPASVTLQTTTASKPALWNVVYNDNDMANTVKIESIPTGTALDVASRQNITITIQDKGSYPYGEQDKNSVSCTFEVYVQDIKNPTLTCPSTVTIYVPGESGVATWADATITDNDVSPAPTITGSTPVSGTSFNVATPSYTVTFTGKDYSNNVGSCQFSVTVVDTGKPYFVGAPIGSVTPSCPDNIVLNSADYPDSGAASAWWGTPVAVDWKGVTNNYAGQNNPLRGIETFALGVNTISYIAQDAAGNQEYCRFNVTIVDTQIPVITCPSPAIVPAVGATADRTFTLYAVDDYSTYASLVWTSSTSSPLPNSSTKLVAATGLPLGVTTFTYVATDAAGNSAIACTFTVTVVDTTPPTITCPSTVDGNVGAIVGDSKYGLYKRIPGATVTAVAVSWPSASVDDNTGAADLVTTYLPVQGTVWAEGTHPVTATTRDAAGNSASCTFNVQVWKPYQEFSASAAFAAVSRMVLSENPTTKLWEADVQYVTQVQWPHFLKAPANFPSPVSSYLELTGKRNCARLVTQGGQLDGVYESLATTAYCYQYWSMKVMVGACDNVVVDLSFSHPADCKPADCSYADSSASINLKVNSGNLCETDLGLVQATADLYVLDSTALSTWLSNMASPPTSAPALDVAFDRTINALVIASSNEVNFRSVKVFGAVRRVFANSSYTGDALSTTVLIENSAINTQSGFTVGAAFNEGVKYAAFNYAEQELDLNTAIYVKLTVTVIVEYELGQATRRRMVDVDIDVNDPRRDMLQALPDTGSVGLDASASLSIAPAGNVGSNKLNKKAVSGESFFFTPGGVVIAILFALIFLVFISCCVAYTSYKRGLRKGLIAGEKDAKSTFKDFASHQHKSIINKVRGSAAPIQPRYSQHKEDHPNDDHRNDGRNGDDRHSGSSRRQEERDQDRHRDERDRYDENRNGRNYDDDRKHGRGHGSDDDRHNVDVQQRQQQQPSPTAREFATPPSHTEGLNGRHDASGSDRSPGRFRFGEERR
eukprot:g19650.t1